MLCLKVMSTCRNSINRRMSAVDKRQEEHRQIIKNSTHMPTSLYGFSDVKKFSFKVVVLLLGFEFGDSPF